MVLKRFVEVLHSPHGETDKARGLQEVEAGAASVSLAEHEGRRVGRQPERLGNALRCGFCGGDPKHAPRRNSPAECGVLSANALGPIGWNKSMHILMDDLGIE